MDQYLTIFAIMGALLIGVMSPGPSFIVVARTSLSVSRRAGLAVSLGMGLASTLFALMALAGLHVILEQVAWLYLGVKIAGGGYLIYLAWRIFKGAGEPLEMPDVAVGRPERAVALWRMVMMGFLTQISNPKTAVVFASVFATFFDRRTGNGHVSCAGAAGLPLGNRLVHAGDRRPVGKSPPAGLCGGEKLDRPDNLRCFGRAGDKTGQRRRVIRRHPIRFYFGQFAGQALASSSLRSVWVSNSTPFCLATAMVSDRWVAAFSRSITS